MMPWFRDLMLGCESLSLDSEADRETLWMNLESMLSGMRLQYVNSLISDEAKKRAYEYESARHFYCAYAEGDEGN